jgi:hypothetical protein
VSSFPQHLTPHLTLLGWLRLYRRVVREQGDWNIEEWKGNPKACVQYWGAGGGTLQRGAEDSWTRFQGEVFSRGKGKQTE